MCFLCSYWKSIFVKSLAGLHIWARLQFRTLPLTKVGAWFCVFVFALLLVYHQKSSVTKLVIDGLLVGHLLLGLYSSFDTTYLLLTYLSLLSTSLRCTMKCFTGHSNLCMFLFIVTPTESSYLMSMAFFMLKHDSTLSIKLFHAKSSKIWQGMFECKHDIPRFIHNYVTIYLMLDLFLIWHRFICTCNVTAYTVLFLIKSWRSHPIFYPCFPHIFLAFKIFVCNSNLLIFFFVYPHCCIHNLCPWKPARKIPCHIELKHWVYIILNTFKPSFHSINPSVLFTWPVKSEWLHCICRGEQRLMSTSFIFTSWWYHWWFHYLVTTA